MRLGEYETLTIVKKVEFGVYLAREGDDAERVLLPKAQVPEDAAVGGTLRVFLYRDSKDRMIATCREPKLTLGEYAPLLVKEVGK